MKKAWAELNSLEKSGESLAVKEAISQVKKRITHLTRLMEGLKKQKEMKASTGAVMVRKVEHRYDDMPRETKLVIDEVKEAVKKVTAINQGEDEKLQLKILRNLKDELEEIETERGEGKDTIEKEKRLRRDLGVFQEETDLPFGELAGIIRRKEEGLQGKISQVQLADILARLNKAAENSKAENWTTSPDPRDIPRDERFRYLGKIANQKENFRRIQDQMGGASALSESFRIRTEAMLLAGEENLAELRQAVDGPEWYESLPKTIETLEKVRFYFSREIETVFEGRRPAILWRDKRLEDTSYFSSRTVSGYEALVRRYLSLIASRDE